MSLKIQHVGIVVDDLEAALHLWRDVLGLELSRSESNPAEGVDIHFLAAGGAEIELLQPHEAESALGRYLAKRGAGMHHLCLGVDDLDASMNELRAKGVAFTEEQAKTRHDGTRYCFIHPKSGGGVLIELYEEPQIKTEQTKTE